MSEAGETRGAANALRWLAVRLTVRRGADVLVPSPAMAELVGEALGAQPEAGDRARGRIAADFYRHKRHDILLDAGRFFPRRVLGCG
jgi:hypothetical protein